MVERRQADRVLLADHQVGQRGREVGPVVRLAQAAGGVVHRCGGVEEDRRAEVRLFLVQLHVELLGLGVGLPVEVLQVVAGHVLPVLRELDRGAVEGRPVEAGDEPLHHAARDERQVRHLLELLRVEVPVLHL